MSVLMTKGGNVSLTKLAKDAGRQLRRVTVECGWSANRRLIGHDYDLDLSAAGLNAANRVPGNNDPGDAGYQQWFVWANHRVTPDGSIRFMGDDRTGGTGERIQVDLARVPSYIESIIFEVVIWLAEERKQRFGKVKNAYIRVFDQETGEEFARFNLGADFSDETLMVFGQLYRHGNEWKFRAIGQGSATAKFREDYGIKHTFETDWARFPD